MSVRSPVSGLRTPSGYFGSFMLVDRHRRQDFWTHMFKQHLKRRKIGQKKTVFKQERSDRPKSVFEKSLKNFPQAMYARKYRIVFYWIHMFGVKPHKNQHFQLEKHVRLTCADKFKRDRTKALRATLAPRVYSSKRIGSLGSYPSWSTLIALLVVVIMVQRYVL